MNKNFVNKVKLGALAITGVIPGLVLGAYCHADDLIPTASGTAMVQAVAQSAWDRWYVIFPIVVGVIVLVRIIGAAVNSLIGWIVKTLHLGHSGKS